MSDDDLELGGLAPTTPMAPIKRGNAARPTKPSSRAEPGPSKPKTTGRKRPAPPSDSEIEEVHRDVDSSEVAQPGRRAASQTEPSQVNGKRKGRAKAPSSKAARQPPPHEPIVIDASPVEILEDEELEDEVAEFEAVQTGRKNKAQTSTTRPSKGDEPLRLREQLRRAEAQVEALSRQLEEVFQVRETEAEQLLNQQALQYEAQLQAQEILIKELTKQTKMKEPLMRSGSTSVLNLMTREAADEEKKTIEEDVGRWKNLAVERQKTIEEHKASIRELQQIEKDLRFELKAEIDRSNTLAAKASKVPGSAQRNGRPGGVDDPKQTQVMRFYEDMTNIIVPNIKASKGKYLDLDEWVLSCVYTHNDPGNTTDSDVPRSLNFTLRCCYDEPASAGPISSKDQLVPTVNYIPLALDKEPPSFVEKLEFLGSPFTFGRDQLALFLKTIHANMGEAIRGDENE